MQTSGQRLQLYQDFLSYSVLETGEMKMRYETGNVNPYLSEVCRSGRTASGAGLALYSWPMKLPELAFDSAKLQRVISNLWRMLKFTPAGGTVWLHAEPTCGSAAIPTARRFRANGGGRTILCPTR